jgi:hypothetical protein
MVGRRPDTEEERERWLNTAAWVAARLWQLYEEGAVYEPPFKPTAKNDVRLRRLAAAEWRPSREDAEVMLTAMLAQGGCSLQPDMLADVVTLMLKESSTTDNVPEARF